MHARKSIFHTHFGAEEEHQNKRITYPILRDKMSRMKARTQPVAHTKRKAQPPDRCCETGRRSCLPIGLTLRPKGRTDHQPASASLHRSSFAFKGGTAGASRCRAPPSSMVAATTKDYGCIWKDKQCVCANSGTYAKSKSLLLESGSSQTWGTQPRSSKADNLSLGETPANPPLSPPATGFWAPVAPWHQAYTEG